MIVHFAVFFFNQRIEILFFCVLLFFFIYFCFQSFKNSYFNGKHPQDHWKLAWRFRSLPYQLWSWEFLRWWVCWSRWRRCCWGYQEEIPQPQAYQDERSMLMLTSCPFRSNRTFSLVGSLYPQSRLHSCSCVRQQ